MATLCRQCGDEGLTNAFVYCVRCLKFAVHRYCLDTIPETVDEFVYWFCDGCEAYRKRKSIALKRDVIPCEAGVHKVSERIKAVSRVATEKSNTVVARIDAEVSVDSPLQLCDVSAQPDLTKFVETNESSPMECRELKKKHAEIKGQQPNSSQQLEEENNDNLIKRASSSEMVNEKRSEILEPSAEKDLNGLVKDVSDCTIPAKVKKSDDILMKCASSSDHFSLTEIVNKERSEFLEPSAEKDHNRFVKDISDCTLPAKVKKSDDTLMKSASSSDDFYLTEMVKKKRSEILEPSAEKEQNRLVKDVSDSNRPAKLKKSDDTRMKPASSLTEMINKKRSEILEPSVEKEQNRLVKDVADCNQPAKVKKSDDTLMKSASSSDDFSLTERVNKKRSEILKPSVEKEQNRLVKDVSDSNRPAKVKRTDFTLMKCASSSDDISLKEMVNKRSTVIPELSVEKDQDTLKDVTDCTLPAKAKTFDDTSMKCASSSDDISLKRTVNGKRSVILEHSVERDRTRLVKGVTECTQPAKIKKPDCTLPASSSDDIWLKEMVNKTSSVVQEVSVRKDQNRLVKDVTDCSRPAKAKKSDDTVTKCASSSDDISLKEMVSKKRSVILEHSLEKDQSRLGKDVANCTRPAKGKKSDDTVMMCASSSDDISLKEMVTKRRSVILEPSVEKDQNRFVKDITDCSRPANAKKSDDKLVTCASSSYDISLKKLANKKRSGILEPSVEKGKDRLVKDVTDCTQLAKTKKSDDTLMRHASSSDDISLKEMVSKRRSVILEPSVEKDQNRLMKGVTDCIRPAKAKNSDDTRVRCASSSDDITLKEMVNKRRSVIVEPSVEKDKDRFVKDVKDCTQPAKAKKCDDTLVKCSSSSDGISIKEMVKKKKSMILDPSVEKDQNKLMKDVTGCTLSAKANKSEKRDRKSFSEGSLETETDGRTSEHATVSCNDSFRNSKKMKTTMSSEANLEEQRQGAATAQISENNGVSLGIQCFDANNGIRGVGLSSDYYENIMIEFGKENSGPQPVNNLWEQLPKYSAMVPICDSQRRPQPVIGSVWKGSFNILHMKHDILDGLMAHLSTNACQKVHEEALLLRPIVHLEMLPKSDIWPKSFQTAEPSAGNIGIYFFPSTTSEQSFDCLVDKMMQQELAMRAVVRSAELLVFPSNELPLRYWMFQSKYYLWGVFREKRPPGSRLVVQESRDVIEVPADIPMGNKSHMTTTMNRDPRSPQSPLSNSVSNESDRGMVEHPIVPYNESFRSSKKIKTIISSKADWEVQRHEKGSAPILYEKMGIGFDTHYKNTRGRGTGPSNDHYENMTREFRGESGPCHVSNSWKQYPNNSTMEPILGSHRHREPIIKPDRRGSFDELNKKKEPKIHPKGDGTKSYKTKESKGKCFHCGKDGHWKRNCSKYHEFIRQKKRGRS